MKQIPYILVLLVFVGCSTSKKQTGSKSQPTKFVFKKSTVSSQGGISKLESKLDSLINSKSSLNGNDSLLKEDLKKVLSPKMLLDIPEKEINIEILNDSIWRYTTQEGKMFGDYLMIQKNSGVLNYYDKSKSVNYKKYDLFATNNEYEVIENRKDRKEIKEFDCYKLTLIKKEPESDLGNTIYEMYVTNQIDLPIHAVINLGKLVQNSFPMEIRVSEENLPGMETRYELIEIKN